MDTLQRINPHLDPQDMAILRERATRFAALPGPRVGDWVQMADGSLRRFTHDWGDDIQTTLPNTGSATFYLTPEGCASYSGGLDRAILKSSLTLISEALDGRFWFFHHNWARAHNGVDALMPCRLFKQL